MAANRKAKIIPPYVIGSESRPWKGLNTSVKDSRFLKPGESPDELNWITGRKGDNIQLRRGSQLLGLTQRSGTKVTGLGVGTTIAGTQVPFFSSGRSIYEYDTTTNDTYEMNTANVLPSAADGEDVNFNPYTNLAGSMMYITSPNSGQYKIPVANPRDIVDQMVQTYRFAFAKINRSRMFGMQRKGALASSFDASGLYLSYIDRQTYTDYPAQVTNKVVFSGNGSTKAFSGTLSGTGIGAPNTIFSVMIAAPINVGTATSAITKDANATISSTAHGLVIGDLVIISGVVGMTQINGVVTTVTGVTDANTFSVGIDSTSFTAYSSGGTVQKVELFNDGRSGILTSNLGGTGTINYATGAWAVTFNTAPANGANNGIANYYYENATSHGILDFSYSTASRVAGSGNLFRQDDGGGNGQAVWSFQGIEYAFHKLKSWVLTLDSTDTSSTNQPYYENIGIPYPRAAFPTGEGVIFLDNSKPAEPKVSILKVPPGSTNTTVLPEQMSIDLDLSVFAFDYCVVFRWGEYDIVGCQNYTNGQKDTYNSVTFVRNIYSGNWNRLDYPFTCLATYNGTLISGDSLSPNLYTLFSGFDDLGQIINNYYTSSQTDLGIDGIKKVGYFNISGLIQASQELQVSISLDGGAYVPYATILGNGAYVAKATPVGIGSFTLGDNVIGGGSSVTANQFELDIPIKTDKFEYISFMLKALNVGYIQVDQVAYKDIRFKRRRPLSYNDPEISG